MVQKPSATVFRDVSNSLKDLLETISELQNDRVLLESPANMPQSGVWLSLFLYRLEEDYNLRNLFPTHTSGESGPLKVHQPPKAYILEYMMVPYGKPDSVLIVADKIKRLLTEVPVLRGKHLQGRLRASGNESISLIPVYPPMEKVHNIWMGFIQKPYRLSLFYNAIPVMVPSESRETVTPVGAAALDRRPEEVRP